MRYKCPRCHAIQEGSGRFCNNCGVKFAPIQPPQNLPIKGSNKPLYILGGIIGGLVVVMFIVSAIIGVIRQPSRNQATTATATTAQTPAPTPLAFAELKTKGNELLKFERNEYKKEDLNQFDVVMQPLKDIPKEDKNYKEAQALHKKLIDKVARIGAEIVVLGEKPDKDDLYIAFNQYLRNVLNDYSSSEYINYTGAVKLTVKGEPFWVSVLTLRAKNAFGAYIVKDVTFYIRNKKVVTADGL